MASLLNTIKQVSMAAASASSPVNVLFGIITKINPLEVNVDQRFTLPADFLVVPETMTEKKMNIEGSTYIIRTGLKIGDAVILLRAQGGQQYIVCDRVVNS